MKKISVDLKTPIEDQLKDLGIQNHLSLEYVTDLHPSRAYLEDVDDGKSMCGISPEDAIKKFNETNRLGLTLREGLALFRRNPKILQSHYLDLVGTRYYSGFVPCLYVFGGKPALNYDWEVYAGPQWGAPSAGSVSALEPRELGSVEPLVLEISEIVVNGKTYRLVE